MTPRPALTPKSERTRERILQAALALFAEQGFQRTTMRDIAARAEVSLGLTYRYFGRKEDLAVALYDEMSDALRDHAANLYGGTLAERFARLMEATIAHLDRHRDAFLALAARAFDPADDIGVLGDGTAAVRERARAGWLVVVDGASDAPSDPTERANLADALYTADLLLVLIWTQDKDPARVATAEAIRTATELLATARPMLSTFFGAAVLARVAGLAGRLGIGRAPGT